MSSVTFNDIQKAAERISPYAHRTPIMTCHAIDEATGSQLFFKCEQLQKVGAFKFRGACNAVLQLSAEDLQRGVVTHSSGNHAQALALAARTNGATAHIVMPTSAPAVKRAAVAEYGANIIDCDPNLKARELTAQRVLQETGGVFIPPYDHPLIIAGQGTTALELCDEVPSLDAIIAPVGGGGLLSGCAIAAKSRNNGIRVIGAEPSGADDAYRSKQAGELIPQTAPNTIADGLLTSLGKHTWPIIRDEVDEIISVDDDEIIIAMRLLWQRAKLLVEPSAACALAAAFKLANKAKFARIQKVGIILSGGNVDIDRLPW